MLTKEDTNYLTQTGPGTPMGNLFRRYWQPALLSQEIPAPDSAPVRVKILGENLVAIRATDGTTALIQERCPHRGASLFFGRNEEQGIRCVYHGWKFGTDGQCVDMPNEPAESDFFQKVKAVVYPTKEMGGIVWAYLGDAEHQPELPKFEWAQVPESHRHMTKVTLDSNYLQSVEGDIDSSHTAFLHGQVGKNDLEVSSKFFDSNKALRYLWSRDKAPKFFVVETPHGLTIGARRDGGRDHYYWRITQWVIPSVSMIPGEVGGTQRCNFRVPMGDTDHQFYRIDYIPQRPLTPEERYDFEHGTIHPELKPGTSRPVRDLSNDFLIDRALQKSGTYSGIRGIVEQDYAVTSSMGLISDRSTEQLGTSDMGVIRARRVMMRLAKHLESGGEIDAHMDGEIFFMRSPALLVDKDVPFDVGARRAMDAEEEWSRDVEWATVMPVLEDENVPGVNA
ncbi:nitrite reductase/ring-hydroxylating ferredoxin subunit [Arthrobacter ginsengisoli]|uniref:Nitrite reductase/ring-hydroxylating ferredoxin subunit n=1 Tax=Arthrobacter ginsengisoli TaxID=1356565 RepID=A0ABU1UDJ9_9MICC|nr:Rieske 2Fe-2S domain-containing protein [Arthrobacter ginsengisoli]MDR7083272.1 nitrite reductase/ring-hydroxylating ferredoxin subunit [Arthrobacter ginsengisoli]